MASDSGNKGKLPSPGEMPRHVAIIMDGNGRWAKQRHMPRVAGHRAGVESVQRAASASMDLSQIAFEAEKSHFGIELDYTTPFRI